MTTNTHRLCLAKECQMRSTYGIYLTDLYCKIHSAGEIINYEELEDKDNTCEEIKLCGIYRCKDKAEYNFENCKPLMCQNHAIANISLYKINKLRNHKTPRDCTRINCISTDEIEKKAIIAFVKIKQENKEDKVNTGTLCLNCYNIIKDEWISNNKSMIKQELETIFSKCLEKSCKNKRVFGTTSSNSPAICEYHYNMSDKVIFDVNNKNKVCKNENCKVRATFNLDGLSPEYCVIHKTEEMINTDAKRCEVDDCKTQPTFGYEDDIATRCKEHSLEDMIDIKSVLCEVEECKTQAHYGFDKKIRCSKHKSESMEIIYKTQICNEENCNKYSCYGFINQKQEKCYTHRLENMINVKSERCEEENCNIVSSYGFEHEKTRRRCSKHKLENMKDLSLILCEKCKETNMNKKYKPYCYQCFAELNPDSERVIEYKTKENAFLFPAKELYDNAILDKRITGSNEKFRPDFLLEMGTHCIIVEIDENQHNRKMYDSELEVKRLNSFKVSLGNKLLIIIRLNPDNYRINNKQDLVYGCFKYNFESKRLITQEKEFNIRLNQLLNTIKYYIEYENVVKCVDKNIGYKEVFLFYSE